MAERDAPLARHARNILIAAEASRLMDLKPRRARGEGHADNRSNPEIVIDQSELRLFLCPRGRPRRPECQQGGERRAIAIRRHPFALSRRSGETPLAGTRLTKDGVLVIFARTHRSQERNRQDALARLLRLIAAAEHRQAGASSFLARGSRRGAARRPPKPSWLLRIRSSRSLIVSRTFKQKFSIKYNS
jgi:hypothetical protein